MGNEWGDAYRKLHEQERRKKDEESFNSLSEHELLRRAVANARSYKYRKGQRQERWIGVQEVFLLGSTFSHMLCRKFGFNPNEEVKR